MSLTIYDLKKQLEEKYQYLLNDNDWIKLHEMISELGADHETIIMKYKALCDENKAIKDLLKVYLDK
jgi:hypothetical protein